MFFFLQEKNNTDLNSFYTPQIISDMLTQAVCDELDDSDVIFTRSSAFGAKQPVQVGDAGQTTTRVNTLISVATDPAGKSYSVISHAPRTLTPYAQILAESVGDWGKSVAFAHEARKARPIPGSTNKSPPLLVIHPLNLYSPHLLDYLRHTKLLAASIAQSLVEIYGSYGR